MTTRPTHAGWQSARVSWWLDTKQWRVLLARSGPASWPRTADPLKTRVVRLEPVAISALRVTESTVRFHVSRIGVPVLVKVSYFPRWHATGATGPYQVSPNLMVVVPTSHVVELSYGGSPRPSWARSSPSSGSRSACSPRCCAACDVGEYGPSAGAEAPSHFGESPRVHLRDTSVGAAVHWGSVRCAQRGSQGHDNEVAPVVCRRTTVMTVLGRRTRCRMGGPPRSPAR